MQDLAQPSPARGWSTGEGRALGSGLAPSAGLLQLKLGEIFLERKCQFIETEIFHLNIFGSGKMLPADSQPHLTTGLFCLVSGNPMALG